VFFPAPLALVDIHSGGGGIDGGIRPQTSSNKRGRLRCRRGYGDQAVALAKRAIPDSGKTRGRGYGDQLVAIATGAIPDTGKTRGKGYGDKAFVAGKRLFPNRGKTRRRGCIRRIPPVLTDTRSLSSKSPDRAMTAEAVSMNPITSAALINREYILFFFIMHPSKGMFAFPASLEAAARRTLLQRPYRLFTALFPVRMSVSQYSFAAVPQGYSVHRHGRA
jgi:hypothetical protein